MRGLKDRMAEDLPEEIFRHLEGGGSAKLPACSCKERGTVIAESELSTMDTRATGVPTVYAV